MSNGNMNGTPQPRKKTLLNDWRQPHPATKDPMPGGKYPAQGMWEVKNKGAFPVVFKISDGVFEKGQKNTHKEVEMNYADRGSLFEGILEACADPNFGTKQMPVMKKSFVFAGGQSKMSDNPVVQATFTITRNKEGQILLGYSKGDYKAQLIFKGANFTTLYMKNDAGEKVEDVGTMSRWAARAWVNFHRELLDTIERDVWEAPPPKNDGAGYNNGGRNNNGYSGGNGGGGGGGNSYNDSSDDDIDDLF